MIKYVAKKLTKAEKEQRKDASIDRLRQLLLVGSSVYTVLTHVSRNGMSRRFKLCVAGLRNGQPCIRNISGDASEAMDSKWHGDGSVQIGGCGMDMGFAIVSDLSTVLHGKYDALRQEGL